MKGSLKDVPDDVVLAVMHGQKPDLPKRIWLEIQWPTSEDIQKLRAA